MIRPALFAALLLAACSNANTATSVAGTEVALTAAEKLATEYVMLPDCAKTSVALCSDQTVVAKIKTADNVAFNAVTAARKSGSNADVVTANAAVAALVTLIPEVQTNN